MQPNLSLVYNSDQRNGWIGVGWSLDMGSIQRSTKKGLNYNGADFVASLNGASSEPIQISGGEYGAKIEESFSKYQLISTTAGWVVTAKDGKKYCYGRTGDSRQENSYGVFKWCLDKVEDTNGNSMTVSYTKDQGRSTWIRSNTPGITGLNPSTQPMRSSSTSTRTGPTNGPCIKQILL